jgi:uncharacterized protein (DUF2062 family)
MKKYIRDRFHFIIKLNDPPKKLALAFALGVFVAFTPTIGLHILTCLVLAWAFRLSKLVIITASFINNPWTIMPLYGFCIWFGVKITGDAAIVPHIAWDELRISTVYPVLKPYLLAYVVGTLLVGAVAALVSYFLFYWAVVRYRQIEKLAKAGL